MIGDRQCSSARRKYIKISSASRVRFEAEKTPTTVSYRVATLTKKKN